MLFQSKEDSRDCSNVEYGDLRRIFLQVSRLIDNDELSEFQVNKEPVHESSPLRY